MSAGACGSCAFWQVRSDDGIWGTCQIDPPTVTEPSGIVGEHPDPTDRWPISEATDRCGAHRPDRLTIGQPIHLAKAALTRWHQNRRDLTGCPQIGETTGLLGLDDREDSDCG